MPFAYIAVKLSQTDIDMLKIEHLGIAVKDLNTANDLYAKLLGKPHYKVETVASENG